MVVLRYATAPEAKNSVGSALRRPNRSSPFLDIEMMIWRLVLSVEKSFLGLLKLMESREVWQAENIAWNVLHLEQNHQMSKEFEQRLTDTAYIAELL